MSLKIERTFQQEIVEAAIGKSPRRPPTDEWIKQALDVLGVEYPEKPSRDRLMMLGNDNGLSVGSEQSRRPIPPNPTNGWRLHELLAHDIPSIGWSDAERTKRLRQLGYDIPD